MSDAKDKPADHSPAHTPGEWHYCRANADTGGCPCGLIWAADGETVVAIAQGPQNAHDMERTPSHEARVANGRLISAAPALLRALRLVVRYEAGATHEDNLLSWSDVEPAIKEALALVDGDG